MTGRARSTPARRPAAAPARGAVARTPSSTRKTLVETQILEAATDLFAERGFAGTSLQDIADATGLTRPALYHYFASKDELLARLVSAATEVAAVDLRRIRRSASTPITERLRQMAASVALLQARHPARFRALIRSEADLPDELAATYAAGRRSVLREFTTLIGDGVRSGEFRAVDPRTAALAVIGLCNWVAWWHKPGEDADAVRVADELAELAVAAVAAGGTRTRGADGMEQLVGQLRQDVTALERLVRAPRSRRR